MDSGLEKLRSIKSFPSLLKYLRDELEWPIESDDVEDLTFEYEPDELGIDRQTAVKIKEIKQLRPLASNQPWGIFYLGFEPKQLPIVALRRILRALVIKKRESANQSQMATWELNDLLFISAYGESEQRQITFAHFSENSGLGDLPTLKVLGWNTDNTVLRLDDTHQTLKEKLHWPEDETKVNEWRERWSAAFKLQYRETVRTSKDLSIRLADLATVIRKRANNVLQIESAKGELRKLYSAFQEALIHDLSQDDFADMYAQTIAYGLLSARISRPAGLVADNLADMVPVTNPFLKELLQTFLTVGGRKSKIDFDELGINEVVELLRQANMEEVLKDFGARNPNEDPVIHFYELFLKEYDPEKRMKRGVFYTPKPVVSFIVRSVHEILQKEFGLADGLADTTTWAEFVQSPRFSVPPASEARREQTEVWTLNIPEGVKPDAPFVQILDPATGTGTFLVEVIEQIHKTLVEKWTKEGKSNREQIEAWNEYVPKNLLPRLYGFELMMAPYSIAHMKIGLKLSETGYGFSSNERAQIYLTNTLEEPKDFSDYFATMSPALAHEAEAANRVKRQTPITVVLGNPPYSNLSANLSSSARELIEEYKFINGQKVIERNALQLERNLNDDYVKFISWSEKLLTQKSIAVLSFITNGVFSSSPSLRGMRVHLLNSFSKITIYNLHGASQRGEAEAKSEGDENVFEIEQPVAISLFVRDNKNSQNETILKYDELIGKRETKYKVLLANSICSLKPRNVEVKPEMFYFNSLEGTFADEYENFFPLSSALPLYAEGIKTGKDWLVTDYDSSRIIERLSEIKNSIESDEDLCNRIGLTRKKSWNFKRARKALNEIENLNVFIKKINYRVFDVRNIFYHPDWVASPSFPVMQNFIQTNNKFWKSGLTNLAFASGRISRDKKSRLFWCSQELTDKGLVSSLDNISVFPLLLYPNDREKLLAQENVSSIPHLNLSSAFIQEVESKLKIKLNEFDPSIPLQFSNAAKLFHYIYAVLNSPTYNNRYSEFLSLDFPRLPLTTDRELFRQLCALGANLVALHLLEGVDTNAHVELQTDGAGNPPATAGGTDKTVAAGFPKYDDGKVFINKTTWFDRVPAEVWHFHIGGYQVCHKWLKDRKGRTLSAEDIAHYGKITVALAGTIRLMAAIDEVIEEHGGFPLVGSQTRATPETGAGGKLTLPFA